MACWVTGVALFVLWRRGLAMATEEEKEERRNDTLQQ